MRTQESTRTAENRSLFIIILVAAGLLSACTEPSTDSSSASPGDTTVINAADSSRTVAPDSAAVRDSINK